MSKEKSWETNDSAFILKDLLDITKKRQKLGLNPICANCGRVMKTRRKDKYSAEYRCKCTPDLVLCVG